MNVTTRPDLAQLAESYAPDRRWWETDLESLHYEILKQSQFPVQSLLGWKFKVNHRAKSRLGLCDFGERVIQVSGWLFDSNCRAQIVRTLAHEMAHVITRQECGRSVKAHGQEWKGMARALGHHGNRTDGTDADVLMAAQVKLGNRHPVTCSGCGAKSTFGRRMVKEIEVYGCKACKRRTGTWEMGLWKLDLKSMR